MPQNREFHFGKVHWTPDLQFFWWLEVGANPDLKIDLIFGFDKGLTIGWLTIGSRWRKSLEVVVVTFLVVGDWSRSRSDDGLATVGGGGASLEVVVRGEVDDVGGVDGRKIVEQAGKRVIRLFWGWNLGRNRRGRGRLG
ncbi:Uncharacterized protein Adt_13841 [Abeliophyllum distichum]|uniref:Uncharacterized protein n=1 Tax=Abeliophyllum distichum TaxID=126358 RepID=A0ABD1TXY5_9LAMI